MSNLNNALNTLTDELKSHRRRVSEYGSDDGSSSYFQGIDSHNEHDYDDDQSHPEEPIDPPEHPVYEDIDHDGICDNSDDFDSDDS